MPDLLWIPSFLFFPAKRLPFEITFLSDGFEAEEDDELDFTKTDQKGFKLKSFQNKCGADY